MDLILAVLTFLVQFMFKLTPFVLLFMAGYVVGIWHLTHIERIPAKN